MTDYKPLTTDDSSPCMKCGSILCAFCSEDVRSAVMGLFHTLENLANDMESDKFHEAEIAFDKASDELEKWFPVFFEDEEVSR